MVAPRKTRRIVCTVVRVPVCNLAESSVEGRPSDRLPWYDPTIARLVASLQDEVRYERRMAKLSSRISAVPTADLDPPGPQTDDDWNVCDEPRWTWPY